MNIQSMSLNYSILPDLTSHVLQRMGQAWRQASRLNGLEEKIKVGVLQPDEEGWGCISLSHLGLGKKCNYCCYVLTPMWIVHLL